MCPLIQRSRGAMLALFVLRRYTKLQVLVVRVTYSEYATGCKSSRQLIRGTHDCPSADLLPASALPDTAARLQRCALAAATAPGARARLAAEGCHWYTGTWRVFPGTPDQVAKVRRYIRSQLAGHPALDDAMLAASELASNALCVCTLRVRGGR